MIWIWTAFIGFVLLMLALGLGVFHRRAHVVTVGEALAGLIDRFRYLKASLAFILVLVGVKMLAAQQCKELLGKRFNFYLLGIVLLILALGVIVSLLATRHGERPQVKQTK